MPLRDALRLMTAQRDQALVALVEDLRIPSISASAKHSNDVRRNAGWLAEHMESFGMRAELHDPNDGGFPVLRADLIVDPRLPTVTIYGHYDVQPPTPLAEWETPPFEPTQRDGLVYARGAADNKGNHMAALKAVEYCCAGGGSPVNVRFLMEGEEETSGPTIRRYVRENQETLHSDCVLIWDGTFTEDDHPALLTALRGLLYIELNARGAAVDLHSGEYGGIAPNALNTLARVLGELKDRAGFITVPDFYDRVVPTNVAEVALWQRSADYPANLQASMGARALEGEPEFTVTERQWTRPTLDVNGLHGGFTEEGVKTVIPAIGTAKLSMRLVAEQDPDEIFQSLRSYVGTLTTPGVDIEVRRLASSPPVVCPVNHRPAAVAISAFEASFKRSVRFARSGFTVPVAFDFQESLGAPMIISGIVQPDNRAHAPNERLDIEHFHNGIEMIVRFLHGLAGS